MESQPTSSPPPASTPVSPALEPAPRSHLPLAIIAGVAAALVGAVAWAAVTVTTNYQIGFMAIGVGLLVGFAVRLGNGTGLVFGLIGAILALLGCVLGNFFTIVAVFAKTQNMNVLTALSAIDLSKVPQVMAEAFDPMDLLFYGIAAYEGYRFSQRKPVEARS
jgi:hypothetical protein